MMRSFPSQSRHNFPRQQTPQKMSISFGQKRGKVVHGFSSPNEFELDLFLSRQCSGSGALSRRTNTAFASISIFPHTLFSFFFFAFSCWVLAGKYVGRVDQWIGRSWRRDHCSAHHIPSSDCKFFLLNFQFIVLNFALFV